MFKKCFTPKPQHYISAQIKTERSVESNTTVVFPTFIFIMETKLKDMENI